MKDITQKLANQQAERIQKLQAEDAIQQYVVSFSARYPHLFEFFVTPIVNLVSRVAGELTEDEQIDLYSGVGCILSATLDALERANRSEIVEVHSGIVQG